MNGALVRKADRRKRDVAAVGGGAALMGFGATNAAPELLERAAAPHRARRLAASVDRLGASRTPEGYPVHHLGLDSQMRPVDPSTLSTKRGPQGAAFRNERGFMEKPKRSKPPQVEAMNRYSTARSQLIASADKPLLGAKGRRALRAVGGRGALLAGGGAAWYGAHQLASKAVSRRDVDNAAVGGLAGGALYHAPSYGWSYGPGRALEHRDAGDAGRRAVLAEHRRKHDLARGAHPKGDSAHVAMYRDYPKELRGWRSKRVMSWTHAGRTGTALTAASVAGGAALSVAAGRRSRGPVDVAQQGAQGVREKVRKDDYVLEVSPQYGVGIPATRSNPISPLAMLASSNIMADAMIGASGKRVTRRQRKSLRGQAYAFNMGRGMVFSPLGHGQVTTG